MSQSVSFKRDGKMQLILKGAILKWRGSPQGKSMLMLVLATMALVYNNLRSNKDDNLLALVAYVIRARDSYCQHNPQDIRDQLFVCIESILSSAIKHLMECIGARYQVNRLTEVATLEDMTSNNETFLFGPGAINRTEKRLPVWDYLECLHYLRNKFFTGPNVETLLNDTIDTPEIDFNFKSPFSMAEPTISPVKPASVKGVNVPRKKQTFAKRRKMAKVSLSPIKNYHNKKTKGPVKNPYIKKGRSMMK